MSGESLRSWHGTMAAHYTQMQRTPVLMVFSTTRVYNTMRWKG